MTALISNLKDLLSKYLSPYQYLLESPNQYYIGKEEIDKVDINNILVETIRNFMTENNLFEKGVIISLSGGVDSMVIFSCLLRLRLENYYPIYVVSINYNLRDESEDEALFIKKFCRFYNVVFLVENIENSTITDNRRGIIDTDTKKTSKRSEFEETSRDARFNAYKHFINSFNCNGVIVGHHKDDIIENIFTNSMKGHNILDIEVMKKIGERKGVTIYRPLLDFPKSEIFDFAHKYNVPYFLDTTPEWSRRGRMRNEIFPLFDEVFTPSWKKKFKEIGTQSNQWNDTIERLIINPWFENVVLGRFGFSIPIKYQTDENLWLYALPKLFFKINYGTIKKKTIVKLLEIIINIKEDDKPPKIILDSGFRATIMNNKLLIYHYQDILDSIKIKKFSIKHLDQFHDLIT
jgi:tRNA(Ile)-lysidine synthetase-like protein